MPDLKYRRFHWLKPGTLNTFRVRAVSGTSSSEWEEIEIRTSGFVGMTWGPLAKVVARPVFWNRTIVVTWTLIAEPLRMDFYRLFRKLDGTEDGSNPPTIDELADNSVDNEHWVKDTGRWNRHVDHILGESPEIVKEEIYWYWVWAFDKGGLPSAHYLGGSGPNTTPDNAEFGKPNVPNIKINAFTYKHQNIIKWLADATLKWEGQAEGYWVQRKQSDLPFWGPAVWADHDGDLQYQEVTMQNFISGVKYDFRVKAVNVPVALVSNWSPIKSKKIPYDKSAPDEMIDVSARRLRRYGTEKGEHIVVQWERPQLAIMLQQIQRYQIFRLIGTEAEAASYVATINALPPGTDQVYDDLGKLEGTRFVDDDVTPIESTPIIGFHFNGDSDGGSTFADYPGGTIAGTLNGTASMITSPVNDGTYALDIAALGDFISFSNTGGSFNSAEGYLEFYVWHDPVAIAGMRMFTAYADANNYMEIYYSGGRLYLNFVCGGVSNLTFDTFLGGSNGQWVHVQARWKVSTQELYIQYFDLGWSSNGGGSMAVMDSEPTDLRIGSPANNVPTDYHFDSFHLFTTYDPPDGLGLTGGAQYYHYWVRAIDIANLKSTVSMGESYDRVSFDPPPAPSNLDIIQNAVQRILWTLYTIKITWDPIDEAVWYRVRIRLKGPGRTSFGHWLNSPQLDEARITEADDDNPDGKPKYVFPFPVFKETTVEYSVCAENMAGATWSAVNSEVMNSDDEEPSQVTGLWGHCNGIWFFGVKLWMSVKLKWDDLPWYEGISSYEVKYYNAVGSWESLGHARPTFIPGKKVVFWEMGMPIANKHKFKVFATDGAGNTSESNILEVPWSAWWDFRAS